MWFYAEFSCIAMDYESSHIKMWAVVISIANIYIRTSFFRTFHKYVTDRCQLVCSLHAVTSGLWYLETILGGRSICGRHFIGRPCPSCGPVIYSLWDCLILIMLVDLRREEYVVLVRLLIWGMNHHVNFADIFSQQLRKISCCRPKINCFTDTTLTEYRIMNLLMM
jgi:hypothetical protein